MFSSSLLVAFTALAGLVSAQNGSDIVYNGQNYSVSGPIAVPPQDIPAATRQQICRTQTEQCPQICMVPAIANTCNPDTLTYNCTCSGSTQPNISDFQQTLPGQVCRIWTLNCLDSHPDDANGKAGCNSVKCGNSTVTVKGATTTTSSGSGTTSAPAGTTANGAGGAAATTASSTTSTHSGAAAAATALAFAKQYSTPLMAGGMAALFGLAL